TPGVFLVFLFLIIQFIVVVRQLIHQPDPRFPLFPGVSRRARENLAIALAKGPRPDVAESFDPARGRLPGAQPSGKRMNSGEQRAERFPAV
ncbi:MAG TPA: hypothetical protein VMS21_06025, partial [Methylomirabilota bacterium]|nr:hypothetical protein [Methylomirabilota bacterium]